MKQLLIVNGHLNAGGVEKSLVNLLRSIDYSNYSVDLLLIEDAGDYLKDIPQEVNVINWKMGEAYGSFWKILKNAICSRDWHLFLNRIVLTLYSKYGRKYLIWLNSFWKHFSAYDVAIAYRAGICADYVCEAIQSPKKIVWWHNGQFDYDSRTINQWHESFRKMNHIICVSESSRKMIEPYFLDCCEKMTVIPNMLDLEEIRRKSMQTNPYATKSDNHVMIVSVGRFSEEKHMVDCVETAKKMIEAGISNFSWVLVGDGVLKPKIEEQIRNYGLEKIVILVGGQSNPYPYIKYADLFVHPSYVESQGIAVLEAMALGKVCVVVRSEGTHEYVKDGINAFEASKSLDSLFEKTVVAMKSEQRQQIAQQAILTASKYSKECVMPLFYKMVE